MPAWRKLAAVSSRTVRSRLAAPTLAAVLLLVGCGSEPASQPGATGDGSTPAATTEPATTGTAKQTAPPKVDAASVPGLVSYESRFSVDETVRRLSDALSAAGMVVATVDYAANAAGVGQQLRPTVLVIGGNPAAGTPLIQASQTVGIDLPLRFLIWQEEGAHVAHPNIARLAKRHGIRGNDPAVQRISRAANMFAAAAAGRGG